MRPATELLAELKARGLNAEDDFGPGPTTVVVRVGDKRILIAHDFNVTGWEAVWETDDHGQEWLENGPGSNNAPTADVVEWVEKLVRELEAAP